MMKIYTAAALDEMCKTRPAGYREDLLSVSEPVPGMPGRYRFDSESKAFQDVRLKYMQTAPARPAPVFTPDPKVRIQPPKFPHQPGHPGQQGPAKSAGYTCVSAEQVLAAVPSLLDILGQGSHFGAAYTVWTEKEKSGGCKSCARGRELMKLQAALKTSLIPATPEMKRQVRSVFADTECLEVQPYPVRWDSIVAPETAVPSALTSGETGAQLK